MLGLQHPCSSSSISTMETDAETVQELKQGVTLDKAIEQVAALVNIPLVPVDEPELGPSHRTVQHSSSTDAALRDRQGYNTGIKRYQDLADARAKFVCTLFILEV